MASRLDRVTDWISLVREAHYSSKDLGQLCLSSRSQLRRFFLAKFGKNPQAWMDDLRLADAVGLLCNTRMNIKEIATSLHYKNSSHFSRQFKERKDCTPSEYANKMDEFQSCRSKDFDQIQNNFVQF